MRSAAEMGDVTELAAMAADLALESEAFKPYAERITELAEDFDFDGIVDLLDELTP